MTNAEVEKPNSYPNNSVVNNFFQGALGISLKKIDFIVSKSAKIGLKSNIHCVEFEPR